MSVTNSFGVASECALSGRPRCWPIWKMVDIIFPSLPAESWAIVLDHET